MRLILNTMSLGLSVLLIACGGGSATGCSGNCDAETDRLRAKRERLDWFLSQGIIPIIDVQSTLTEEKMRRDFPGALTVMDDLGIAQIAFDGAQAHQRDPLVRGYRWSNHVNDLNGRYPDHLFLAANGGHNSSWAQQKDDATSYIAQLERKVRTGVYTLMGELEFRHYLSAAQCRSGRTDRDVRVPIDSPNGHRVFRLSEETGVPFVIHYEPEDALIAPLEAMLSAYPKARVIWAHFGQLRKPALMIGFGPTLVERLLTDHPNLYFDISTGEPNRHYYCAGGAYDLNDGILDTVIWQEDGAGGQTDTVRPEYRDVLERFRHRFVSALDYAGSRPALPKYYGSRTNNLRRILRDLSDDAKHAISYKNAWYLLTGTQWQR